MTETHHITLDIYISMVIGCQIKERKWVLIVWSFQYLVPSTANEWNILNN